MSLKFEDLPAVPFQPVAQPLPSRSADAQWEVVSLGLDGDVFLTLYQSGRGATLFTAAGEELPLKPPPEWEFGYPFVQQFSDGGYLAVESRTSAGAPNAAVFRQDGSFSHAFYAGDGIHTVLVDPSDQIWVGYFDEGVIGGLLSKGKEPSRNGLVRFDRQGNIDFAFNEALGENDAARFIDDIYALTVDARSRAWFSPYTGFYLGRVEDKDVTYVLDQSPAAGTEAILVGAHHVAFYGGYDQPSLIAVAEFESRRLRLLQLRDAQGEPLSFQRVGARAQQLAGVTADTLYHLDLGDLLVTLGPWTGENSSTVASALRFQENSDSGGGGSMLILQGSEEEPQKAD